MRAYHVYGMILIYTEAGTDLEGATGAQPTINLRLLVNLFSHRIGGWGKILGAKSPKFGAEGAVLDNVSYILEKLFLKNVIKSENFAILGLENLFVIFSKNCFLKLQ